MWEGATGRVAFRYFVENGGFSGANSDYIGIDRALYNGPCGKSHPDRHSDTDSYCCSNTDGYFYYDSDG
jgi:hypothetical protein